MMHLIVLIQLKSVDGNTANDRHHRQTIIRLQHELIEKDNQIRYTDLMIVV